MLKNKLVIKSRPLKSTIVQQEQLRTIADKHIALQFSDGSQLNYGQYRLKRNNIKLGVK